MGIFSSTGSPLHPDGGKASHPGTAGTTGAEPRLSPASRGPAPHCLVRLFLCFFLLITGTWAQDVLEQPPAAAAPQAGDLEVIADRQETAGPLRLARGNVELRLNAAVLSADEIDYNDDTGETEARGNVHYYNRESKEDLYAEKVAYNARTELGTFYAVHGTVASASQGGVRILTTDNPFYIEGKVVTKSKGHYWVYDGFVTNCDTSSPWWTLRAPRTRIVPGESATIHRGVFRLKGVPMFYFPYYKKSLEKLPRNSGFLTPNIGNSSRFGFVLGQSYFWAINRSYDATIGGTLYTDRGIASQIGFRGRPTEGSYFDAFFFGVRDRGPRLDDGSRGAKQGGRSFSMRGSARLPAGFRGVAQINYLSSLEFRQAFTQTFEEAVFSQVRSIGFVSKNLSTFSMNVSLLRDENFQSVEPGNTVVIRNLPNLEFNSHERQILGGPLPLWFSLDSSFGLVSRTQPEFQTRRFVQRGDFYPRISTKFALKDFHLTPTFGARQTSYGQSRDESGLIGQNLYRNTKEFSLDLVPPALEKIYSGPKWLGDKVKHVIEPRVTYRYVNGVENFGHVIRFDERDIFNNTNELDVSITNRIYAKDAHSGRVREVFALEVWQRRYFDPDFGGALVPEMRNVFQSTISISPFAFADTARNYSPIVTSMRVQPNWRYRLEWRNDYDPLRGKLVNSSVNTDMRVSELLSLSFGHNAVRVPTARSPPSNQFSAGARVGDFNRRGWTAAVSTIYDYRQGNFIYNTSQVTYNTDCCGFSVEWSGLKVGRTPNGNQFRVSLSIANVGSFGTLRPQERLF